MAVLVDTSVWIDLFRARQNPHVATLTRLLGRQELIFGDLISAEILQGIKTQREIELVGSAFSAYPVLALVGEVIVCRSAEYYRTPRSQGVTARKTVDCLITTWCIENQTPLLHNDRESQTFAQRGLRKL